MILPRSLKEEETTNTTECETPTQRRLKRPAECGRSNDEFSLIRRGYFETITSTLIMALLKASEWFDACLREGGYTISRWLWRRLQSAWRHHRDETPSPHDRKRLRPLLRPCAWRTYARRLAGWLRHWWRPCTT